MSAWASAEKIQGYNFILNSPFYITKVILSTIHNNYMFTAISGVDFGNKIVSGRPHGGVVFVYVTK